MPAWGDLEVVLAVHRDGRMAGAARRLGIDKATVSRRVAALEAALGTRLFERRPGRLVPTPAGERVAHEATEMEAHVRALGSALGTSTAAGAVRVTVPTWFARGVLAPSLPAFAARHPGVTIQLVSSMAVLNLPQREADVAVRNVRGPQGSLVARRAGTLLSAVYASRDYLRARGRIFRREQIAALDFLGYERRISFCRAFHWIEAQHPRVVFRATDTLLLEAGAVAGLGLAVLPCFLGEAAAPLRCVAPAGVGREEIWVVAPADLRADRRVRAVMDHVADCFASARLDAAPPDMR